MDKTKKNDSLVSQFCSVTGASRTVGKQLLEACGGNLELAVNMHMEGGGATTSAGGACALEDDVRAPIPQTQEVLVEDGASFGTFRGRKRKARSVFDGFRDFQAEAPKVVVKPAGRQTRSRTKSQQEEELMAGTSGSRASRKSRTLQDLFRPPIDITFKGTLASARETGKTQGKWLMVNIQNVQEFSCQALNRDVWSKDTVKALIKDNFVFWQVYHDSDEGQRYCHFYKVDSWPYVAILDPRTGENLITWNKLEALTFCDLVSEFLTQHPTIDNLSPPPQPSKRVKTDDSLMDASEDAQLQAAITASLTEVSKPVCVKSSDSENDSDGSDLETFTDSDDEDTKPSVTKSKQTSKSVNKSQGHSSPKCKTKKDNSPERLPRRMSPSRRCKSPLTGSSVSADSVQKPQRKVSPRRNRQSSPAKDLVSSRKLSPLKSTPEKSKSIHNDVHPAVIENIRRNSTSCDEDELNDSTATKDSKTSTTSSSTEAADLSMESLTDPRDYKSFLGPDTDEKTTLMLRLPDGQREKLCVAFSSKLMALVLFVGSHGFSNERFELIAQFPRRQLSQLDFDATLREIGLHAQETIFVQARS